MITGARMVKKVLQFRKAAVTSRNIIREKVSYLIILSTDDGRTGIGECSPIPLLSPDDFASLPHKIDEVLGRIRQGTSPEAIDLDRFPSLRFAVESAMADLECGGRGIYFDNDFSKGMSKLRINGLVWMSSIEEMHKNVGEKVKDGFTCIKLKIGSHDFERELALLGDIRAGYGHDLEIRLDANGAFSAVEAESKLEKLSEFNIHSVEQPIMPGNTSVMARLCASSPIPIALDEELISVPEQKIESLLEDIRPAYIIIKPALLGGFSRSEKWIKAARRSGTGWWVTSALEGNIGLQAIAQWCAGFKPEIPQGLGTGALFVKNFPGGLVRRGEMLEFDTSFRRNISEIEFL